MNAPVELPTLAKPEQQFEALFARGILARDVMN